MGIAIILFKGALITGAVICMYCLLYALVTNQKIKL